MNRYNSDPLAFNTKAERLLKSPQRLQYLQDLNSQIILRQQKKQQEKHLDQWQRGVFEDLNRIQRQREQEAAKRNKQIQKFLLQQYKTVAQEKISNKILQRSDQIEQQKKRLRQLSEEQNQQQAKQRAFRTQALSNQISELDQQIAYKKKIEQQKAKQKELQKQLIEQNIKKMAERQRSYRNFYDQRIRNQLLKSRNFTPVPNENTYFIKILQRHQLLEQKKKIQQDLEEKRKKANQEKALIKLQQELYQQIQKKKEEKHKKIRESKEDLLNAQVAALEQKRIQNEQKTKKLRDQKKLFQDYQNQIARKQFSEPSIKTIYSNKLQKQKFMTDHLYKQDNQRSGRGKGFFSPNYQVSSRGSYNQFQLQAVLTPRQLNGFFRKTQTIYFSPNQQEQ